MRTPDGAKPFLIAADWAATGAWSADQNLPSRQIAGSIAKERRSGIDLAAGGAPDRMAEASACCFLK